MSHRAETLQKLGDAAWTNLEASPGMRAGARAALQELARLRSGGSMADETFDTEVERIGRDNLELCGCDLVMRRAGDVTRFFIRTKATGRTCDLITHFFHYDESETGHPMSN